MLPRRFDAPQRRPSLWMKPPLSLSAKWQGILDPPDEPRTSGTERAPEWSRNWSRGIRIPRYERGARGLPPPPRHRAMPLRKGFLLASRPAVAAMTLTTMASAPAVNNLISAAEVERQLATGAQPLRVECDFVTCSQ